ncbi:MAG: manganese efflux pump MntP family protein [Clostridia bacterium]|nr:manganese efflux pump MntP family protein [Clostridia bacterium]
MGLFELIFISVGLAMDAFAVSVCKGLNMKKINFVHGGIIALSFGVFQGVMPLIGYLLGTNFEKYITTYDHWLAFGLLAFIGGKMIFDVIKSKEDDECLSNKFDIKELLILSVATSIDALAVGITFAFLNDNNIIFSVSVIAGITFAISFAGVVIGNFFGAKFKEKAEIFGGAILILIGIKILMEHLIEG